MEIPDFEYAPIILKRSDGSLMQAFRIKDLPKYQEGVVARYLKERLEIDSKKENS